MSTVKFKDLKLNDYVYLIKSKSSTSIEIRKKKVIGQHSKKFNKEHQEIIIEILKDGKSDEPEKFYSCNLDSYKSVEGGVYIFSDRNKAIRKLEEMKTCIVEEICNFDFDNYETT